MMPFRPTGAGAEALVLVRPGSEVAGERAARLQRALNLVVAVLGLVVTLPLMLLIGVLVKLSSPGPILYTQLRVGVDRRQGRPGGNWRRKVDYGGRLFKIYKFRTMYMPQQLETPETWAQPNDPRVTRVGRILRMYRLDELPQLWNVLKGDMNVVGPRPEQPAIFMELRDRIQHYPERQRVLPGITGWAQINQQYDQCIEDVRQKLEYDLEYAARQSALQDLKIMLRTFPVIAFRKGAL